MNDHMDVRLLTVVAALLCCAPSIFARTGTLRTLDGRSVSGHIRFTPERVVVANAAENLVVGFALSNIQSLVFDIPAPSETADEFGALANGWREIDIGVARPGSTRFEKGAFTVRGAGMNIDAESDSFHFLYKNVRGDTEIVARLNTIQLTHPMAKAGLMMRESMSEYSRNVMLAVTAERGGAFQARYAEGRTTQFVSRPALRPPLWLKLRRRGEEFYAFKSRNGREWTLVEKTQLAMGEQIYVGLAVASARERMLNWTTFDKVREAPKLGNEEFTPQVELVSGSVIPGRVTGVDSEEVRFAGPPKVVQVPAREVSRIVFQPLSPELQWKTRASRSGVWVPGGDFFESEFQQLDGDKLRVSSVLYGLRTFDVTDEVLAAVLREVRRVPAKFQIRTADGSVLLASGIALGDGELKLTEPALGQVRVPSFEIVELQRR